MICPDCLFDDALAVMDIDGVPVLYSDIDIRTAKFSQMHKTQNGLRMLYHLLHLAGVVVIVDPKAASFSSYGVGKDQKEVALN